MIVSIVGPAFFGYLKRIAEELRGRNIRAEFYDEFPSNGILAKIFLRYSPLPIRQRAAHRHHIRITNLIIRSGTTHLLLGTIEMFPPECLQRLKDSGITMCRYAWDSNANKPYAKTIDHFLKAVASFDPQDCAAEGYRYVPLYSGAPSPKVFFTPKYDFFYCATFHSNRPSMLSEFSKICKRRNWSLKLMLFFHSRKLWYLRYIMKPNVWSMGTLLATSSYSPDEIAEATAQSKVVLDIHHAGQTGLTMRTFEALSLGAAVLTTNEAALERLPNELRERVIIYSKSDPERCMRQALQCPRGELSLKMRYFLSVDRFLDQIIALLLGDAEPLAVCGAVGQP